MPPEPKTNPENLSYDQIHVLLLEAMLELATYPSYEFSDLEFLEFPEIRPYAKNGRTPWLNNRNHRIDVFGRWLELSYEREGLKYHPDIERLRHIFGRGWYDGYILEPDDIRFAIATCREIELDGEQPWLEHYLENVGDGNIFEPI